MALVAYEAKEFGWSEAYEYVVVDDAYAPVHTLDASAFVHLDRGVVRPPLLDFPLPIEFERCGAHDDPITLRGFCHGADGSGRLACSHVPEKAEVVVGQEFLFSGFLEIMEFHTYQSPGLSSPSSS